VGRWKMDDCIKYARGIFVVRMVSVSLRHYLENTTRALVV
jgi:hypothetical protein